MHLDDEIRINTSPLVKAINILRDQSMQSSGTLKIDHCEVPAVWFG
jgi:hypothetical protein